MKKNYNKVNRLFHLVKKSALFALIPLGISYQAAYGQSSYTFTSAGATGSVGPTQLMANTYYTGNLSNSVTVTGSGVQSFTIPLSGPYRIEAYGAAGGTHAFSPGFPGGKGAYISGDFTLTAGTVIQMIVGQKGIDSHSIIADWDNAAPGGGGGSFVYLLPSDPTPMIAAGGGGGGARSSYPLVDASIGTAGNSAPLANNAGAAGGTNGNGGQLNTTLNQSYWAGGGAGWLTDGTGGANATLYNYVGLVAILGGADGGRAPVNGGAGGKRFNDGTDEGGDGGFGGGGGGGSDNMGSGGGGGYSGGGGANSGSPGGSYSGGGGGSYNGGANPVNTAGMNTGDGKIVITQLCYISLIPSTPNPAFPAICAGTQVTLTTNAASSYTWNNGATNVSSIVVTPAAGLSTYSVTGTSTAGCIASQVITFTVTAAAPVLSLAGSTSTVCLGAAATITASGALTYTLNTGTFTNNVPFTPAATANYTVYGTNGCGTSSVVTTITVSPLPVTATAVSALVCAGYPTTLTTGGATNYTWTPGPSTQTAFIVSPLVNTTYTVRGVTGPCSGSTTILISTKPNPTITVVPSNSIVCEGSSVTLTVSGAASYVWSPGGATTTVITVNPALSTLYTAIGTAANSCFASSSQVVLVKPLPVMTSMASDELVCPGGSSTLTATGADTYAWTNGGNTSTTVVNPMITTTYSVTGTSTAGCVSSTMVTVSIFNPTISISSATAVCKGGTVTIGASGADSFEWSNGNTFQNISVSPTVTTVYTATGTSTSGTVVCTDTKSVTVTVNPNPTVTAVANPTAICKNEKAVLTADGATSFTWAATTPTTAPTLTVGPLSTQNYTVIGEDANGCKSKANVILTVSECIGIANNLANTVNLVIYPNPSSGDFMISTSEAITLQIINELGQQVRSVVLTNDSKEVKISGLASGVYFITGKNDNGNVKQKIVVAK